MSSTWTLRFVLVPAAHTSLRVHHSSHHPRVRFAKRFTQMPIVPLYRLTPPLSSPSHFAGGSGTAGGGMSKHYASWNNAGGWLDFTSNPSERARNVCQKWNNGDRDLPTCWTSCSCRPNRQRRLPGRGWSCPGLEIHRHSMPISPTSLKEIGSFL